MLRRVLSVLTAVTLILNPHWVFAWLGQTHTTVQPGSREVDLPHLAVLLPAAIQGPARELEQAVRALRAAMDELPVRGTRRRASELQASEDAFDVLEAALQRLHEALVPLQETSPGFDSCAARAQDFGSVPGQMPPIPQ